MRPMVEDTRVAQAKLSPCQRNRRRISPPSSGKAGRRLRTSRTRLMYQARRPRRRPRESADRAQHERHADHERDERPGDRDPELSACEGKLPRNFATPPNSHGPLDLHAFPPRLERVAELV